MHNKYESGNIIMWIFLLVALFAALSYAFTYNSRSGMEKVAVDEQIRTKAIEVIQYASSLNLAVNSIVIDGVADTEVNFVNSVNTNYSDTSCTDDTCKVFNSNGGGISYQKPDTKLLEHSNSRELFYQQWIITGDKNIEDIGTSEADLIVILPYVEERVCTAINKLLYETSGTPSTISADLWEDNLSQLFSGTYGSTTIDLDGEVKGCVKISSNVYAFYEVLLAR